MNQFISYAAATIVCFGTIAQAQTTFRGAAIVPANPTSVDKITYVRVENSGFSSRKLERYKSISMVNNQITITFSEWNPAMVTTLPPLHPFYQRYVDQVDLGRLPPGDYTLTTVGAAPPLSLTEPDLDKFSFKVTDGRPKRGDADATIDRSGHWWSADEPGWGLFIWHDAANNMLAAWFTYAADGKPAWYVFEPKWTNNQLSDRVDLWQTSKPPGSSSPPVGPTKLTTIGTARIGFYFGTVDKAVAPAPIEQFAELSYTLGEGVTQTKILRLYKP